MLKILAKDRQLWLQIHNKHTNYYDDWGCYTNHGNYDKRWQISDKRYFSRAKRNGKSPNVHYNYLAHNPSTSRQHTLILPLIMPLSPHYWWIYSIMTPRLENASVESLQPILHQMITSVEVVWTRQEKWNHFSNTEWTACLRQGRLWLWLSITKRKRHREEKK